MAEPINLNRARKSKDRAQAKATASQNRIAFGRPKAETSLAERLRAKAADALDAKKREP